MLNDEICQVRITRVLWHPQKPYLVEPQYNPQTRPDFDEGQRCDFEEDPDTVCPLIGFRQKERIH